MQLAKFRNPGGHESVGCVDGERLIPVNLSDGRFVSLADLLEADDIRGEVQSRLEPGDAIALADADLLPPIDQQEVWAAGVTYIRSKTARMEESEAAASCYDRVYVSPRPELFFKASPHRVAGTGQPLRIRTDATWNVPEPEITLVLNSQLRLVGFTIGNDMSSRDIEGDNPLYLPQAKVYNQCCGLGPWITLADAMPPRGETGISLEIERAGSVVFEGTTSVAQMARTFEDLIGWLGRDNSFPTGAFLLTGTGIVPDSDFTLERGDIVRISIEGVGTLVNPIVQG
ncbi:MAG: fumarylacetoacetate hydrolase family protein [Pirellulaceae bacterium]|nr:fumarylacetoacetate hydrolase family protein [Planctomycetales bacterium]MCA9221649.1 fumarylacetoacetate hydrolase family protein [Planctomycetales bacterium]MCA9228296.1 fumarylacetoacetate hydrolase family protein [Planctomycetales bacterium]